MKKRLFVHSLLLYIILIALSKPAYAADIINQTVSVDEYFCLYIKQDNSLWARGGKLPSPMHHYRYEDFEWRKKGVSGSFKVMDDVRSVYTCQYSCFAIKTDNSLWAWGGNEGALGCGNTGRQLTPVKIMDNVASFSTTSYNWHGEATAEGLRSSIHKRLSKVWK